MIIRKFEDCDIKQAIEVWNEIVRQGIAFPQNNELTVDDGICFFNNQTYTGVAVVDNEIVGLYILHPNNVGRCSHICNASYAVKSNKRGRHIGQALVEDCISKATVYGFKILQFNAVVSTNKVALNLYKKLGFTQLGVIPKGFLLDNGEYEDIIPHYIELK